MVIVRYRQRLPRVRIFRLLRVDADGAEPRVKHVANIKGFAIDRSALFIGLANDDSMLHTTARHR